MKIERSQWQVNKVIELYKSRPFTEFTLENLKPIRQASYLGYNDIKHIISRISSAKNDGLSPLEYSKLFLSA